MRILVLHGYSGNALWQQKKDQKLETLLAPLQVELHHADAPIQLPPFSVTDPLHRRLSWWQMVTYLTEVWRRHGPFDGIMGYSQGASVAGGYLAPTPDLKQQLQQWRAAKRATPKAAPPGAVEATPAVRLRWRSVQQQLQARRLEVGQEKFPLPTLHIMGESDRVTPLSI
eukprot:Skav215880  [mRNA]  locus=scaffold956:7676:11321:- [translate_table: standard]